jgi:hypothetical protein
MTQDLNDKIYKISNLIDLCNVIEQQIDKKGNAPFKFSDNDIRKKYFSWIRQEVEILYSFLLSINMAQIVFKEMSEQPDFSIDINQINIKKFHRNPFIGSIGTQKFIDFFYDKSVFNNQIKMLQKNLFSSSWDIFEATITHIYYKLFDKKERKRHKKKQTRNNCANNSDKKCKYHNDFINIRTKIEKVCNETVEPNQYNSLSEFINNMKLIRDTRHNNYIYGGKKVTIEIPSGKSSPIILDKGDSICFDFDQTISLVYYFLGAFEYIVYKLSKPNFIEALNFKFYN